MYRDWAGALSRYMMRMKLMSNDILDVAVPLMNQQIQGQRKFIRMLQRQLQVARAALGEDKDTLSLMDAIFKEYEENR